MSITLTLAGLLVLAATVLLAIRAVRRPSTQTSISPDGNQWLMSFSVEKYRPMLRLLDPQDQKWLKKQPGFDCRCARRLAKRRAHIFAQYLAEAASDGRRLHATAWQLAVPADRDVRELSAFVSLQPWKLDLFLLRARLGLALYPLGAVDPKPVFTALESMSRSARMLAAPSHQSAV